MRGQHPAQMMPDGPQPTFKNLVKAIRDMWKQDDADAHIITDAQRRVFRALVKTGENAGWLKDAANLPDSKQEPGDFRVEVVSAASVSYCLSDKCTVAHSAVRAFAHQEEWLQGRGSLLGTVLALATAAWVTKVNLRIWSDREDHGFTAGAVALDPCISGSAYSLFIAT